MKKSIIIVTISLLAFCSTQAAALQISTVYLGQENSTNIDDLKDIAIQTWADDNGLNYNSPYLVEDFEKFENSLGWYNSLDTNVGTFTASGLPGTGSSSYPDDNELLRFQIKSDDAYGRYNQTDGGAVFLDSADVSVITLAVDDNISNMYFFLQDPSDVSATTTVSATSLPSGEHSDSVSTGQDNSGLWFVGIAVDTSLGEEFISTISWETSTTNDGYGLDDFTVLTPVPEPTTTLLFGLGLAMLAGARKRRK